MSKPFDYSKWDNIELSDDEEDVHPNIDKESWFRMKHRSRVEREEAEEKDKKKIQEEMEKAYQRIQVLEHDLAKLDKLKMELADDDLDDDDDDLDDREGMLAEIRELQKANADHQQKLDEYERNKKWNVDNMCHVAEERTIINSSAGTRDFTTSGYAKNTVKKQQQQQTEDGKDEGTTKSTTTAATTKATSGNKKTTSKTTTAATAAGPQTAAAATMSSAHDDDDDDDPNEERAMDSYHEFTEKYADLVEDFMHLHSLDESKEFLLKHGDVLLQENASNYLLLASLEDEMNGYHDKMRLTARQSQITSNIAELAKSLNAHPGNVVIPFFQRLENAEMKAGFDAGVADFISKIQRRAVTKRMEMDAQRSSEERAVDLEDVPREERLGPGGLDPVEVMERLPESMQKAFESRDVEQLKQALLAMEPQEAERLMKDCVDSGLWVQ